MTSSAAIAKRTTIRTSSSTTMSRSARADAEAGRSREVKKVGVLLPEPVSSHGQVYSGALSRVGKKWRHRLRCQCHPVLHAYARNPGTHNVVSKEALPS